MSIEPAEILAAAGPVAALPLGPSAFSVAAGDLPEEGGDPAYGTVRWRTMICADRTPSCNMVLGIAEFGPAGTLPLHRHSQAEFYLGLAGGGRVTVDGIGYEIGAGVALFIPPDAEHGVVAGEAGLSFAYGFATDRFGDVTYRFSET